MREHQISVNLKAQQFEQLQRLARERGFKSVSAYVKQKLLELAMGIEEEAPVRSAGSDQGLSAQVLEDLGRLHGELRSFIGELNETPLMPANSVSLPFEVEPPEPDIDWDAVGRADSDLQASLPVAQASDVFSSTDTEEPPPQVLPSRNLGGFGYGIGNRFSSFTPGSFLGGDRLGGYREIMDDMEELADRAFAISPRLGALDEDADEEEPADAGRRRRRAAEGDNSAEVKNSPSESNTVLAEAVVPESSLVSQSGSAEPAGKSIFEFKTSFVEPISPDKLPDPDAMVEASQLSGAGEASGAGSGHYEDPDDEFLVGSEGGFPAPLPPPPEDEVVDREPNYLPPPAPLPPREPAPEPAEVAAEEDNSVVAVVEDDLLSELLDESLLALSHAPRDENPFAVSLSFAIESAAGAEAALEEPAVVTEPQEAIVEAAEPAAEPVDQNAEEVAAAAVFVENETGAEGTNFSPGGSQEENKGGPTPTRDANNMGVSSFSGSPPPKRRRT